MRNYFIYHRHKAFLNILEMVANNKPINIYIYTNTFTLKAFYAPSNKTMFLSLTHLITKYQCSRIRCMLMSGYILIHRTLSL